MRTSLSFPLLLLFATPACMAQSRVDASPAQAPADTRVEGDLANRSPFGRVMGIMITALQQDALRRESTAAPAARKVTAGGTPTGIELGEAFRLDGPASPRQARNHAQRGRPAELVVASGH